MYRRDYLKKQIDELGQVLGKLVNELLKLSNEGNVGDSIELTNQTLKTELNIDLPELTAVPTDQLIAFLNEQKLSNESMDALAHIFLIIADNKRSDVSLISDQKVLYEKCIAILEHLEKIETIYSMDRHVKLERIKKLML